MIYGEAQLDKIQQKQRSDQASVYNMNDKAFTLGFKKDWSATTILGLPASMLDGDVKSARSGDSYKNNISGYVFGADIATTIGKFNIDANLFYGSAELDGSGFAGDFNRSEAKHKGTLYGFSGSLGIPLKFGDDLKFAPNVALHYRKFNSDAYDYHLDDMLFTQESASSESLSIPITIALKKDFELCFGRFTPILTFGLIKEFKESAMGAYTYNASAAWYASPDGKPEKAEKPSTMSD